MSKDKPSKQWHPLFAELLRPLLQDYFDVQTNFPVGDVPREADILLLRRTSDLPTPFTTITVDSSWERGLLGVALDPQFPHRPFVYLCSSAPAPYPHHRISRFTARGDVAVPDSEAILFEGDDQSGLGGGVKNERHKKPSRGVRRPRKRTGDRLTFPTVRD